MYISVHCTKTQAQIQDTHETYSNNSWEDAYDSREVKYMKLRQRYDTMVIVHGVHDKINFSELMNIFRPILHNDIF